MSQDCPSRHAEANPQPLFWNARQTSAALNIGGRLLWSLTNSGENPSVRIGKRVLYAPMDLHTWIESRKGKRR